jgi:hypothetical protein
VGSAQLELTETPVRLAAGLAEEIAEMVAAMVEVGAVSQVAAQEIVAGELAASAARLAGYRAA